MTVLTRLLGQAPVSIYETVPESTEQTTIADVILGAAAVVFGLAAVALVCGAVLAGVLIGVRRARRAGHTDEEPDGMTRLGL